MTMAKEKEGALIYKDWIDKIEKLTDQEAGQLMKHLFRYINDLEPKAPNRIVDIAFSDMKTALKRDLKKWENIKEKRSEAGKASAEKRKINSTKSTSVKSVEQNSTNPTVKVKVNVKDNVNVKDIKKREANFKKEILPYIEKGLISGEEAKKFISYWTEHGERDKKMRFEKERSWNLKRRIDRWNLNAENFKEKNSPKKEKLTLTMNDLSYEDS